MATTEGKGDKGGSLSRFRNELGRKNVRGGIYWKPTGYVLLENWENQVRFSGCGVGDRGLGNASYSLSCDKYCYSLSKGDPCGISLKIKIILNR